jgi:hypothetical protein
MSHVTGRATCRDTQTRCEGEVVDDELAQRAETPSSPNSARQHCAVRQFLIIAKSACESNQIPYLARQLSVF